MILLTERPSKSIELEIGRFLNVNSSFSSGEEIAEDMFKSIADALAKSKLDKKDRLEFWLELENLIVKER